MLHFLAKLIIQQELSETLAEEAVYREAFDKDNQESGGESDLQLRIGFGNIIDTFLHDQESYLPTQTPVTQSLNNRTPSVPVTQPLVAVTDLSFPVPQSSAHIIQPVVSVTQSSVPLTQSTAHVTVISSCDSLFSSCNTVFFSHVIFRSCHTGSNLCSVPLLIWIPVVLCCFTVFDLRRTGSSFCGQPVNVRCTDPAYSHSKPEFSFNISSTGSVSVKLLNPKFLIKLLVKFIYSNNAT